MNSTYVILIVCFLFAAPLLIWMNRGFRPTKAIDAHLFRDLSIPRPLSVPSPFAGVSFEDALAVTPMWEGIRTSSEQSLIRQFAQHFGDGVLASTNAVRFIQQTGEYVVEFSKEGKALPGWEKRR